MGNVTLTNALALADAGRGCEGAAIVASTRFPSSGNLSLTLIHSLMLFTLHLNQKRCIAGQMPQVRQSALLIVPLAFEIRQPVPVQSIPVALRLNLPPVVRIVVLFGIHTPVLRSQRRSGPQV